MRNISQTKTISDVLNAFTFGENSKGKSFSETIKHSTIFSFWSDIVGAKFSKYTKPIKIKYSKLYVSAKSPVVVQELNLIKNKIITKINVYAKALGFSVKDIVFDYKNYTNKDDFSEYQEEKPDFYNLDSIKDVVIDKKYASEIENAISKIDFLTDSQKKKFIEKIINAKKAEQKRLSD